MLAMLHGPIGLHHPTVEIPCWWVERGEILVAELEALYADRRVPVEKRLHPRHGA
jgi:hypothetical protein